MCVGIRCAERAARPTPRSPGHMPKRARPIQLQGEGHDTKTTTRRSPRWRRALLVGTAAVAGITLSGTSVATPRAVGEQEFPTALAGHLAQLAKTAPGKPGDGRTKGRRAPRRRRSSSGRIPRTPSRWRPRPRAQAAFSSAKGRPFPSGKGKQGHVGLRRPEPGPLPEDTVPELVQLRPDGLHRRRPDHRDRDRADLQAG